MVRTAFSSISCCRASIAEIPGDDAFRELRIALDQRTDRVGDLLLHEAAHLGDAARDVLQVRVERPDGVFRHDHPKRPVM